MLAGGQHPGRDILLIVGRVAGKLLDGAAIEVAGGEIHLGKVTAGPQLLIHQAHLLEQLGPIDVRDEAHAGDDIADSDV